MNEFVKGVCLAAFVLVVFLLILSGSCYVAPQYSVYSQRMEGMGKLAEAESSRQIAIEEAKAKMESSKMLAQAEIERAKGVAQANEIIGDSLKDNESYLWYLWISNLEGNKNVIYVPTECQLPILEAGRFGKSLNSVKGGSGSENHVPSKDE